MLLYNTKTSSSLVNSITATTKKAILNINVQGIYLLLFLYYVLTLKSYLNRVRQLIRLIYFSAFIPSCTLYLQVQSLIL